MICLHNKYVNYLHITCRAILVSVEFSYLFAVDVGVPVNALTFTFRSHEGFVACKKPVPTLP